MTRASLLELAARVEAAQGADRILNADVLFAVGYQDHGGEKRPTDPQGNPIFRIPDVLGNLHDAASLLQPHHRVHVMQHETYTAVKVWDTRAAMFVGSGTATGDHAEARARTAAALRARAEEATDAG